MRLHPLINNDFDPDLDYEHLLVEADKMGGRTMNISLDGVDLKWTDSCLPKDD